jgi:hypothetical protein
MEASEESTLQRTAEWGSDGDPSPLEAQRAAEERAGPLDDHPELAAVGAFAGGFLLAQVLKRLGGEQ